MHVRGLSAPAPACKDVIGTGDPDSCGSLRCADTVRGRLNHPPRFVSVCDKGLNTFQELRRGERFFQINIAA